MPNTKYLQCILILTFFWSTNVFSISATQIDTTAISQVKQNIQDGSATARTLLAYKRLIKKADQLLDIKNPTVMDKTINPPTGNKHDYLSISRYWWPNPDTTDGLPWIRKDGETNPDTQTDAVDRKRLGTMTDGVKTLCYAYFFSEDERYAQKAASMLKTWFLEEETRMHPHLNFAQGVPGIADGRASGVLDGKSIAQVVPDALTLLSKSAHWQASDTKNINKWLSDYLTWLMESDLAKKEINQENNHGSWCKFQVATLALHLGKHDLAKATVEAAQESLEHQLDAKGGQTHELERTRSFFYSCYNLNALTHLAQIGDQVGLDMWYYKTETDKNLLLAINFLAPVADGNAWNYTEINGVNETLLLPVLVRISKHTDQLWVTDILNKVLDKTLEEETQTGKKNSIIDELCLSGSLNL